MSTAPTLSVADLEYIAPFHLLWDNDGRVIQVSKGLRRFWHDPNPEELDRVTLVRPFPSTDLFPLVSELTDMVIITCHQCCLCGDHQLRGEVRNLGEAGWLLIGLPNVSRVADLEQLGFTLSDLPLHIGLGDLLIANEAAQVSLAEAKTVENTLIATNQAISKHNELFVRFVPSRFLEALGVSTSLHLNVGRHVEMHGTIMFADMHGFTTISESVKSQDIFGIINQYLAAIVPCIEAVGGIVVQYQGDGVLALFPGNDGSAIDAAIAMQRALKALNKSGQLISPIPLKMSVGLHDGPIVLGIVGAEDRWDASMIADAVNTSARIESMTRVLGGEILVSQSCLSGARNADGYLTRSLGKHAIRGRKGRLHLVEILDATDHDSQVRRKITLNRYNRGLEARAQGDIYGAISAFSGVLGNFPDDKASQYFLAEASRKLLID